MEELIRKTENKLNEYKEMLKLMPKGDIHIRNRIVRRQGKKQLDTSYVMISMNSKDSKRRHEHRLKKGIRDESMIRRLLQKKSLKKIIPILEDNLKIIKNCNKRMKSVDSEDVVLGICQLSYEKQLDLEFEKTGFVHEEELVTEIELSEIQDYYPDQLWNVIQERQNNYYRENMCIGNKQRGFFRSKSEYIIAGMLMDAGIEFKYEPCVVISERVMYPDFIIRSRKHSRIFIWEHAGLMNDEAYRFRMLEKIEDYAKTGIYPLESLLLSYDMKNGNMNMDTIQHLIDFVK